MARRLPTDVVWTEIALEREDVLCGACGRRMHVKKHRHRRVYTLAGPVCYVLKVMHCPHSTCPNHRRRFSPEQEVTLAMPTGRLAGMFSAGWVIGVLLGIGRCRNSVPSC